MRPGRLFVPGYAVVLAAILVTAGITAIRQAPLLVTGGLLLAAAAPASFLLWRRLARPEATAAQTVAVSCLVGLGCVTMMVQVYRFGDEFRWALVLGLAALAGWLVYTRWILRPAEQDPDSDR